MQGPDKSIAVVADIYTRNVRGCDKNGVLHVATGNANNIYVVVEIEGNLYLTRGATFQLLRVCPATGYSAHGRTQPFGMLNGGASLALAEIAAGHGSMSLCREGEYACGIQVSGNHISSVPVGGKVIANGQLIHRGNSSHIWNIDITTPEGKLVSTIRVVNFILKKK